MSDEEFISICEQSLTMAAACSKIGTHFNTFKKRALKLNCYKPNKGSKGRKKENFQPKILLQEILNGNYPSFQTYKLKHRLFKEGIKENKCEVCGIEQWNGLPIQCELDHIDGDKFNHKLENLRVICPNCHSQTETYRFKRGKVGT